jgi:hypothetical protein
MSRGLEEIARWMISRGYATGHGDSIEDLLGELEAQAKEGKQRLAVRECRSGGDPNCLHCVIHNAIGTLALRRGDAGVPFDAGEIIWAMVHVLIEVRDFAPDKERAREFEDEMIDQLAQAGFPVMRAGRA